MTLKTNHGDLRPYVRGGVLMERFPVSKGRVLPFLVVYVASLTLTQAATGDSVEDVLRAWQRREEEVTSFRFVSQVREVVIAKSRTPPSFAKTDKKQLAPPEDRLLHREVTYLWKPGKAFYREHGEIWDPARFGVSSRDFTLSFGGDALKELFDVHDADTVCPLGVINYEKKEKDLSLQGTIRSLVLIYRPLSQFLEMFDANASALNIRESRLAHAPAGVSSVAFSPAPNPQIVIYVWVDPEREYLPLRWIREQGGRIVHDETIEYRQDRDHWLPEKWRSQDFKRGQLVEFSETTLSEAAINVALDEALFEIDFPYGTWVNEYRTGDERTFLVLENGSRRYLTSEEADVRNYEELMRRPGWYRRLTILAAVVIGAAILFVVYKKVTKP